MVGSEQGDGAESSRIVLPASEESAGSQAAMDQLGAAQDVAEGAPVSKSAVPGIIVADASSAVPSEGTGTIVTASLESRVIGASSAPASEAGSVEVVSPASLTSVNTVAESGSAILWLVTVALMAVVWMGRRNDGGA